MDFTNYQILFLIPFVWLGQLNADDRKEVDVFCYEYYTECSLSFMNQLNITHPVTFNFPNADKWKGTTTFDMSYGQHVTTIPFGIFQQFPNLTELKISSGLESITSDNFIGAHNLSTLHLELNKIQRIPSNLFALDSHKLQYVDLSWNNISEIEPFAFNGTERLEVLMLRINLLTKIEASTFAGAPKLHTLDIGENKIEVIEEGAFNLPQLKEISLSCNRLKQLDDNLFVNTPILETINLFESGLTRIGHSLDNLNNLRALTLNQNRLTDIPFYMLAEKPHLKEYSLGDTGLTFDNEMTLSTAADPYVVEHLNISFNALMKPDILQRLNNFGNLISLDLSYNQFETVNDIDRIPELFPHLKRLIVIGNKFTDYDVQLLQEKFGGTPEIFNKWDNCLLFY